MSYLEELQRAAKARRNKPGFQKEGVAPPPSAKLLTFPIKDSGTTDTLFPVIVTTGVPNISAVAPLADETVEPAGLCTQGAQLLGIRKQIDYLLTQLVEMRAEAAIDGALHITLTTRTIALTVAKYFRLSLKDLLGPEKLHCIVVPRMVAMYLTREITGRSFPVIGLFFKRDHSTCIHAWQEVGKRRLEDKTLNIQVTELNRLLTGEVVHVG